LDAEIVAYRWHGDLQALLGYFSRHGEFLARAASYVIGYADGFGKSIAELSPKVASLLPASYFERTWHEMTAALLAMWQVYPAGWKDLTAYKPLADAIEGYYLDMGLILSTAQDGRAYVNVPMRPGTTPWG